MKDDDLKVSLEKLRRAADKLEQGPPGPRGPAPAHEWKGTELRFERSDGAWGKYVDLRGPRGQTVGGGTSTTPFDLNSLPLGDPDLGPDQIAVRQNGQWTRVPFGQFLALIVAAQADLPLALDGDPLSLDGLALTMKFH